MIFPTRNKYCGGFLAKSAGGRYNNTMAFKIFRNDITKVRADAIVNTANHRTAIGRGTDSAIYRAAGSEALFEARRRKASDSASKKAGRCGFAFGDGIGTAANFACVSNFVSTYRRGKEADDGWSNEI
ncbi:MAG: hypothetical protein II811_01925, partial [Spirochaetaceae bacterium]|nr:hypothetical protein [Spirochaetaceae bacterium]